MNGKRPLVGMAYCDTAVRDNEMRMRTYCTRKYFCALQKCAADVILLPPTEDAAVFDRYLDLVDGILLPGGEDIDPRWMGEEPSARLGGVNPLRDAFELELTRRSRDRRIPVLGICRGLQVLVVALGGSLHQDIAGLTTQQHSQQAPRWATSHRVILDPNSLIRGWAGSDEIFTNSFHHQVANRLPEYLKATGHTADGLIEVVESADPGWLGIGVQWHPEETLSGDEVSRRLFNGFISGLVSGKKSSAAL
ncbi:MAG TPA: gamma-glutamyl-gamma-aminobutyrate hydrolase family protein [Candidatus Ozemobacteraceae bacterium]|nr:gamma-glutamyl-gamma-aminobutyrate hydrolase family protein [Candidatus Ozemobacteraceae bacterium]